MKNIARLSLIVASVAFVAFAALAEAPAAPLADVGAVTQDGLLQSPAQAPDGLPESNLFVPEAQERSSCSATLYCPYLGRQISCTGTNWCFETVCYVICDGQWTYCTGCIEP